MFENYITSNSVEARN